MSFLPVFTYISRPFFHIFRHWTFHSVHWCTIFIWKFSQRTMVPLEYSQPFILAPKFKQDTLITIIAPSHECKNAQSQLVLELCQLRLSHLHHCVWSLVKPSDILYRRAALQSNIWLATLQMRCAPHESMTIFILFHSSKRIYLLGLCYSISLSLIILLQAAERLSARAKSA